MKNYALIAEPEAPRRSMYAALLEEAGLLVVAVADGSSAEAALLNHGAPALTLTELSLPYLDGFALIDRIRRVAPVEKAKVVVISAFRELRDTAMALRAQLGISAILAQAASPDSLRRVVTRVLAASTEALEDDMPLSEPPDGAIERRRLASLDDSGLVDDEPPPTELQELVASIAREFSVPIALVSLVLADKEWFKAYTGLTVRELPRLEVFCRQVVSARAPLIVPDATTHPYYRTNPVVLDGFVRGYAGAPIITPEGDAWGSLCVIDPRRPLRLGADDLPRLTAMAKQTAAALERRRRARRPVMLGA